MCPSPWRFVKHLDIVLIIVDILGCKSIYSTYKILEYSDCLQAAWKMKAGANFPCNYMIWFASLPVTLEITGHWHVPTLRLFSIIQIFRYLDIHCSAEFTEIILLEVALLVFPAEVRMTEVHTGRGGSGSKKRITHQI